LRRYRVMGAWLNAFRERILGVGGSMRRRRFLVASVASVVALGAILISTALAVHDEDFQLDGDLIASTNSNGGAQPFDWDSLFNVSSNGTVTQKNPLPGDFTATSFDKDFSLKTNGSFNPADNDIFTTGSKDELPISGWQCKGSNNVTDKNDIMNAYSAQTSDGDNILYFGVEKNDNTGTNNVGFWFLQDNTVNCDGSEGTRTFTGAHQSGDLLIVSEFDSGGRVSTIKAYEWQGGANGSLDVDNPVTGGDCEAPAPADDDICATTNKPPDGPNGNGTIGTPWPTANKTDGPGNSLRTGEFFEGGLNLTDSGFGAQCFNTFLADTRASTSTTSDLEDFSRGSLGGCTSSTVTTPVDNDGTSIPSGGLDIPADPAEASIQVKDKATVSVTGVNPFAGTLTFHLCGPFAAGSSTLCNTGGVLVDSQNITTNNTYTSAAATVTSAGRYCWRADFDATTSGVPDSSDSRASECFVVNPRTPTLTTQAGAGPVDFGQPVTDKATLSNTAHKKGTGGPSGSTDGSIGTIANPVTLGGDATGTITFTLYKDTPSDPCSVPATGTPAGGNPQTLTLGSGSTGAGNGDYGPVSFTPDAPGRYIWVADYSGDPPNTTNPDPSSCSDENEDVVVRQIPTEIRTKQSWYPNDTAEIKATTGNLAPGGKVKFELFTNDTCTGAPVYSEEKTIAGGAPTEEVSTSNPNATSSYKINTGYGDPADSLVGRHSWKVVYTPAASDTAHTGKQSACDAEHFNITYTNDAGPGTNLP
jgi:hypothetical protein